MPLTTGGSTCTGGGAFIGERFDPETGLRYLHDRVFEVLFSRKMFDKIALQ
jgi:hypothetical protein